MNDARNNDFMRLRIKFSHIRNDRTTAREKKTAEVNKSTYGLAEWLWPRGAGMSQRTKGPNLKKVNFNKRSTRYIIAGFTHLSNSYARSLALVEG